MDPQADSWLCSVLLLSDEVMETVGFFLEEEDVPSILNCCTVVHWAVARTPMDRSGAADEIKEVYKGTVSILVNGFEPFLRLEK